MGKDSSEIRREIDATRARMGDTVEALGYKADVPSRVKDAVHDRVETVKGAIGGVVDGVQSATQRVGEALGGAQRTVTDRVGDATDRLGDATGSVTGRLGGVAESVQGHLPDPRDLRVAAQRGAGIAAENPLGLAIGAAAVGFLAGLLVPVTEYERNTVGPIRDDLLERAQHIGSDALEHGKAVLAETAQAAMSTAQDSAQRLARQVAGETNGSAQHGDGSQSNGAGGSGSTQTQYGVLQDDT